jgi:hypothetical protein
LPRKEEGLVERKRKEGVGVERRESKNLLQRPREKGKRL